jgi:hypothetical protein
LTASEITQAGRSIRQLRNAAPEETLSADAIDAVHQVMAARGGVGSVVPMNLLKLVADHAAKFLVTDASGASAAVVSVSPSSDPEVAMRAHELASQARAELGDTLGDCVLIPWHVGRAEGVSFSISAYGRPLWGAWSRWRVGPEALRWLEAATKKTERPMTTPGAAAQLADGLRRLAAHPALSSRSRLAASRSVAALAAGEWLPRQVLAHFDLWSGNLLWTPRGHESPWPFAIIDWGGSRTDGFAAYDLVRLGESLRLRPPALARQLMLHGAALGCPAAHMRHHFMAALSQLADKLGEWPAESFGATADSCLDRLDRALRWI